MRSLSIDCGCFSILEISELSARCAISPAVIVEKRLLLANGGILCRSLVAISLGNFQIEIV